MQQSLFQQSKLDKPNAEPFLKWAGGKRQLIDQMKTYFPPELETGEITTYIEPFVGSGAVFFYLNSRYSFKNKIIADTNPELILAYKVIESDVGSLISFLLKIEKKYKSLNIEHQKAYYYETRRKYNSDRENINYKVFDSQWVERTAELIFLNRTCFNGLYRVNASGDFNVPQGSYTNPNICDAENLEAVSEELKDVQILQGDFSQTKQYVDNKSFVYFDPPYRPLSKTAMFNSYSKEVFGDAEQLRLADYFSQLDRLGAKLMLSNSDPTNTDPNDHFFEKAYAPYKIVKLSANRMINSKVEARGLIREILVMNYSREKMKYNQIFSDYLNCKSEHEVFAYLMATLTDSISGWDYFVNWQKAKANVKEIEMGLNLMNYLVGKDDIVAETRELFSRYPELISIIPILIACRQRDFIVLDAEKADISFNKYSFPLKTTMSSNQIEDACQFLDNIGFLKLLKDKSITNLPDYVFGVNVGLDTNARKNRSGTSMENLVGKFLRELSTRRNIEVISQATSAQVKYHWGIEIQEAASLRRYDFAVKSNETLTLFETNYYGGGGSKLKATAGEYRTLARSLKSQNINFVWITDGKGWLTTQKPLLDAFQEVDYILNIKMMGSKKQNSETTLLEALICD